MQHDYGLTARIGELKGALGLMETAIEEHTDLPERLAHLRRVVGGTRKSVWAVLAAANSDDYNRFLSEFRLRRATETLRVLEGHVENGVINTETSGAAELLVTLTDVLGAVDQFVSDSAQARTVFTVK